MALVVMVCLVSLLSEVFYNFFVHHIVYGISLFFVTTYILQVVDYFRKRAREEKDSLGNLKEIKIKF